MANLVLDELEMLDACTDACDWIREEGITTRQEAWSRCPSGEWMVWYLRAIQWHFIPRRMFIAAIDAYHLAVQSCRDEQYRLALRQINDAHELAYKQADQAYHEHVRQASDAYREISRKACRAGDDTTGEASTVYRQMMRQTSDAYELAIKLADQAYYRYVWQADITHEEELRALDLKYADAIRAVCPAVPPDLRIVSRTPDSRAPMST